MKILHVIVDLDVGGAETMLRRLIESDPASISSCVVVSLTSVGKVGQQLRSRGVEIHDLGMRSAVDAPIALWRLVRLIRRCRPRIVQTWMYHADLLGGMAARLAGNRNVVWGVRRSDISLKSLRWTTLVMKACALSSSWIPKKIVCAAEAAKKMHIAVGYDASRLVVIPNGFEFAHLRATTKQRTALRQACGFAESDVVVGCVGRFDPDKGQENFIKAASRIARSYTDVKFLLVGRDCDADNVQLGTWLSESGLQKYFVLLGERNDVPVCLAAMDIFCMPSRSEGFPNGLGEAMAMGLPCVATRVGDASILAGETAVFVPPEDEQALANGLSAVLNLSAAQRYEMGAVAKARVLNEFSIEKAAARFKAVYQEVISETEAKCAA